MSHRSETPFDNIESSHKYVSLLAEAIDAALAEAEAEADIALAGADHADRRREALWIGRCLGVGARGGVFAEAAREIDALNVRIDDEVHLHRR